MGSIGDEVKKIYREELESSEKGKTGVLKKGDWKVLFIVLVTVVIMVVPGIYYYNQFAALYQAVLAKKGQLEKEFQRRNDLMPNLIETVKDYAIHERELFRYVSEARVSPESIQSLEEVMNKLEKSKTGKVLSNLIALAEQYPNLKATQNFQNLMDKLEETENRIADMREAYNFTARRYNTLIVSFPSTIYGYVFRFKEVSYFKAKRDLVPEWAQE